MSRSDTTAAIDEPVHREYPLGVQVVECAAGGYRFEAPRHEGQQFDDASTAALYADVYFDANGFEEAGTGERGVPPAVVQAGRDTLVAYFLTRPEVGVNWVASFYGEKPEKIERYRSRVRKRAAGIRDGLRERNVE